MKKEKKLIIKIKQLNKRIITLTSFLIIFATPFMPVLQNISYAEPASAEEANAGRSLGTYRVTTYTFSDNDDGAGNFGTTATASGNPATPWHTAAIDIEAVDNGTDRHGIKMGDRVRIGDQVFTVEDYGSGPDKSTFQNGADEFIDLYVNAEDVGKVPDYAEVFLLDGTTTNQASEIASDLADYTAYIKVCGSKKDGYYLNFIDDIDKRLQEKIDAKPSLYQMYNITIDTLKEMIKAEIATEFPDFGEPIDVSDITGTAGSTGGALSGTSHYNITGEFAWPVPEQVDKGERASKITSLMSKTRVHPVFGDTRPHDGMDIAVPEGHDIIAIASGTVTKSGDIGGYGNLIEIQHDDKVDGQTWTSKYGHNSQLLVSVGTHVEKGQVIALAGSTGWSTGPHCHLQIEINGEVTDPLNFYTEDEVYGQGYNGSIIKGLKPKGSTKATNTSTNTSQDSTQSNNTTSNTTSNTISNTTSNSTSNTTSNTTSNSTSNSTSNTTSNTTSDSTNDNEGKLDVVAAAEKVHKIIENGYRYANDNSHETVEESEAQGQKTVDCSTYVDWVLHEIGLNIDNRYCPNLQAELDSANWCTRVEQSEAQAGDIVLFYGHVQIYGGKAADGSDMWYNAGSDEAIAQSAPPGRGTPFSNGPVGIYHINNAAINSNGDSTELTVASITNSNSIKEGNREEAFQGAVNMRRVTPNVEPGEFNTELGEKEYTTDSREGEEGRGTKKDIPQDIQEKLKRVSCKNNTSIDFDELQYLEIPYINFWGDIKKGSMIVNKTIADEVLDIFQELYNIKYPIENMQIIDNYYSPDRTYVTARASVNDRTSTETDITNANDNNSTTNSTDDSNTTNNTNDNNTTNTTNTNDTTTSTSGHSYTIKGTSDILRACQRDDNAYSFYYEQGGSHATGFAIDLNPYINPIVQNGEAASQTESRFLTREADKMADDNEKNALLTKESKAVKIFEKYGWKWGGDSTGSSTEYCHFEKPVQETTTTHIEGIESKISDLSFVPKDIFDALVQKNDDRALQTFTIDSSFNIVVASWTYQNGQKKITTGSTLNFRKGLNKYTMPVEFLAAVLIDADDPGFVKDLAKLGQDSEYVIAVEDSIKITKTKTDKKEVVGETPQQDASEENTQQNASEETPQQDASEETPQQDASEETNQQTEQENQNSQNTNSVENFLFVGDSITKGMEDYEVADVPCTFRGVISRTARGWLNDFSKLQGIENVSGINIMLGTNDFEDGDSSISNLKQLIEQLHTEYPNVQIYVDKILPTAEGSKEKWTQYNQKLDQLGLSYVKIIDPSSPMPELEPDGTHPTASGSKTLWNNIKSQIQGGGTTPTATNNGGEITTSSVDGITEQVTQKPNVTYIDCWYVKMEKENTYKEVAGQGKIENIKGKVTRNTQGVTTNNTEDNEENNTTSSATTSNEITSITYEYLETNYHVTGNAERFLNLYTDMDKYESKRNVYMLFLETLLSENESTVNKIDIMKYLTYQAKNFANYGSATLEFTEEVLGPDDMSPSSSANGTGNASGTLNITGGNTEQKVWNTLKSAGYSDVATAAVMGNIYGESNFNPDLQEAGSGIGYGLCQWSYERRTNLERFAESRGQPASNEDIQIEFLLAELSPSGGADGYASYQFAGTENHRNIWMTTTDIEAATTAFCAGFERPSIPRNSVRTQAAQQYFDQYASK